MHSISVPTFKNHTLVPHIEVLVTDTVIKQFQQDGTYQIASGENADATLTGQIYSITRNPARSLRENVLATTEFNLGLIVKYTVVGRDGKALASDQVSGTTSFFVSSGNTTNISTTTGDVTTDERQALPLATEDLATRLVAQLSEGW
ncbi:MAG TPA: LptE family protein [Candidatus Udaeobacter sp.]